MDRRDRTRAAGRSPVLAFALIALCFAVGLIGLRAADNAPLTYDEATRRHEAEVLSQLVNVGGIDCVPKKNLRTYLIMGIDNGAAKGENFVRGGQSDVMVLLVVNQTDMTYTRVPINRNTLCEVHSYDMDWDDLGTSVCQIALAYAHGDGKQLSGQNAVQAVSDYLYGATIDNYIALDMASIAVLNHLAGGVTVTIEDDFSAVDPALVKGKTIRLTDQQAETFVRSRMSMIDDDTNEARMRRQEVFLDGLRDAMFEKTKSDAGYALDVFDTLEPHMVTDMTGKAFSRLVNALIECESLGTLQIPGKVGSDALGFATFEPDPEGLRDAAIALFYRPAEADIT